VLSFKEGVKVNEHTHLIHIIIISITVSGLLKGYDQLLNLVLDGTIEYLQDPRDPFKLTDDTRSLGLVVCRGTAVVLICPSDTMEPIANPFLQQENV
jgi:U6 snRNA-associated Sm-like protein LSm7